MNRSVISSMLVLAALCLSAGVQGFAADDPPDQRCLDDVATDLRGKTAFPDSKSRGLARQIVGQAFRHGKAIGEHNS